MLAAWGKGDMMGTEVIPEFGAPTIILVCWPGCGNTTSPQLMQDWFPTKTAMAKWLTMCLRLCKAPPGPCTACDNPLRIYSPNVLAAGLSHLPPHPPLPKFPSSFPSSFPSPCQDVPVPSIPFPGAGGSPGCCWLRCGPRGARPQHPTPVHAKTWQHRWHIPIPVPMTAGTKAPCSCHPHGLRRHFPINRALCTGCFMLAQPSSVTAMVVLSTPGITRLSQSRPLPFPWPGQTLSTASCDRDTQHGVRFREALACLSP